LQFEVFDKYTTVLILIYFGSPKLLAVFGWLAASQPTMLFSHINSAPATSHLPASSIFSHINLAPAIGH
jgi:hypothetical protein